ncbi:MAG: hypothetical protein K8R48_09005, partial [Alphaproteobacteria bacterium]|nr:hypothetical protein [Alphaproteobacteria bacterium]
MPKDISPTNKFFKNSDLTLEKAKEIVQAGLQGADYGEFYQEITETESLVKDKGEYTNISVGNSKSGFGFRVGQEERVGYSFSDLFNEKALKGAISQAREVLKPGVVPVQPPAFGQVPQQLYPSQNPMQSMSLEEKIAKLNEIEAYVKSLSPDISNVTLGYSAASKSVHIITADGQSLVDNRPMASLNVQVTVTDKNGNSETGYALLGGRVDCKDVFNEAAYQEAAQKALKQAQELLIAEEAPAGVMDVVLSPGWAAVILHEAV